MILVVCKFPVMGSLHWNKITQIRMERFEVVVPLFG